MEQEGFNYIVEIPLYLNISLHLKALHSTLKLFMGLTIAAFKALYPTASQAMQMEKAKASRKIPGPNFIL